MGANLHYHQTVFMLPYLPKYSLQSFLKRSFLIKKSLLYILLRSSFQSSLYSPSCTCFHSFNLRNNNDKKKVIYLITKNENSFFPFGFGPFPSKNLIISLLFCSVLIPGLSWVKSSITSLYFSIKPLKLFTLNSQKRKQID